MPVNRCPLCRLVGGQNGLQARVDWRGQTHVSMSQLSPHPALDHIFSQLSVVCQVTQARHHPWFNFPVLLPRAALAIELSVGLLSRQ